MDYSLMSNEGLRNLEKDYRGQAKEWQRKADLCSCIIAGRSAAIALREASLAQQRAADNKPCRGCGLPYKEHKGQDHMHDTPAMFWSTLKYSAQVAIGAKVEVLYKLKDERIGVVETRIPAGVRLSWKEVEDYYGTMFPAHCKDPIDQDRVVVRFPNGHVAVLLDGHFNPQNPRHCARVIPDEAA